MTFTFCEKLECIEADLRKIVGDLNRENCFEAATKAQIALMTVNDLRISLDGADEWPWEDEE